MSITPTRTAWTEGCTNPLSGCKAICLKQSKQREQVQHLPGCPTAHNHFSGQRGHCLSWQVPNGLNYLAILKRLFLLIRDKNANHLSQGSLAPREPIMLIEENITMCPILITWVKQARSFYYPHHTMEDGGRWLPQGYTPRYIISTFFKHLTLSKDDICCW